MSLNDWHSVRLTRTGRQGTLNVDGGPTMEGLSLGPFTQLTLNLDLFIGGHRNFDETAKSADVDRSFTGCIQEVHVFTYLIQSIMEDKVVRSICFKMA